MIPFFVTKPDRPACVNRTCHHFNLGGHMPTYDDKVAQIGAAHKQKCVHDEFGVTTVTLPQQMAQANSPLCGGRPSR
ncbi:MAG: hypothetical protein H2056_05150 [Sphingopyxis sp.]|nr:hypothetical protein [Sphingopyxis sp.]